MKNLNSNEKFLLDLYTTRINSRSYSSIEEVEKMRLDDDTETDGIKIVFIRDAKLVEYSIAKTGACGYFLKMATNHIVVYRTNYNTTLEFVLRHVEQEGTAFAEGKIDWEGC